MQSSQHKHSKNVLTFSGLADEVVLGASCIATLINKVHSECVVDVWSEPEGVDVNHAGIACRMEKQCTD